MKKLQRAMYKLFIKEAQYLGRKEDEAYWTHALEMLGDD